MERFLLVSCFIAFLLVPAQAVDRSKFRKCSDTGFCRRYREKSGPSQGFEYNLDVQSIEERDNKIFGKISSAAGQNVLNLEVSVQIGGTIRVRVTEDDPRWQPTDLLLTDGMRAGALSLIKPGDSTLPAALRDLDSNSVVTLSFGESETLAIHAQPFKVELYRGDILLISANDQSRLHYEKSQGGKESIEKTQQISDADRHGGKEVVDYGEDGLAIYADGSREEKKTEELVPEPTEGGDRFGGHTDSQPRGPMSVGLDIHFPFAAHVYGIPQHTSPLSLPTTTEGSAGVAPKYHQPYRLYNLDVFEYELDETMALYGHIPFMLAHGLDGDRGHSAGVFWFNPSETFIDISDSSPRPPNRMPYKSSHWISESGEIDLFLMAGPSPKSVFSQFTRLVGNQDLPPMFSLGYHQCRWNYRDERDVASVEKMFEDLDYPMDVIWLDIEHTDGKRYFTWDKSVFPTPLEMQKSVSEHGRRMVTIVDPHIKRDNNFPVHSEATAKGLYIKNKDGGDFDGWCWPGSSSYLDFTNPRVREWWADRFSLTNYVGSTMDLFTWNDMNEPSVFNGPEVSMPKDSKNLNGIEHREWHNLYGLYMQSATADGLVLRSNQEAKSFLMGITSTLTNLLSPSPRVTEQPDPQTLQRPFVLSRAFWAGSQRYGAIWTGDNTATWGHLKVAAPMLLSINLAGLSFAGADIGGFFGEPGAELFTRWYQAGAFTPFFRGHAHHDTKRREPWVFGEPHTSIHRAAAMTRYSLLPFWYTVFYEAYTTGVPVMRTMFTEFPNDEATFTMDDQWMIGDTLLVKPVTDSGKNNVDVYLPEADEWFNFQTLAMAPRGGNVNVDAPLDTIPVFIRSGKVFPRKMRLRRSSKLMFYDPYTLVITPDRDGGASGSLYMDDEITLAHTAGAFVHRQFTFAYNELKCTAFGNTAGADAADARYKPSNTVERVLLARQSKAPVSVKLSSGEDLSFQYDAKNQVIAVKKPDVKVADDWTIVFHF